MQTTFYKKLFSALMVIAAVMPFSSSANTYKPAQFGDAVNQLTSKVNLPDSFGGGFTTIAVYCQTDVAVSGALSDTLCYEKTAIANLKQQTLDALDGVSFIPAQIDNQAVAVRMQFRVVYSRSGDQPDILMLPNLGTLQTQHGYDYFAPQERLDQKSWHEKYADNPWAQGKPFFNDGQLTRVIGTVKINGDVASVSTLEARGRGKRDADFIETALKQTRFIPGVVNNQVTEMHYVAVLNYSK
jgi:hypothetical protein